MSVFTDNELAITFVYGNYSISSKLRASILIDFRNAKVPT